VARTLLSAALAAGVDFDLLRQFKIDVNGSGQECPLRTFSSREQDPCYTLQYWGECGYYFAGL
jgi:hypothetical protein